MFRGEIWEVSCELRTWCLSLLFCCFGVLGQAQDYLSGVVFLDSFVVTATRQGFDVADFIDLVQEDESFYQAFRNLRFLSYESENAIRFKGKRGEEIAAYEAITQQTAENRCRRMAVLEEEVVGNYFKSRRKLRYYTAKLYDRVFFTHGEECEPLVDEAEVEKGVDKHVDELKRLIFQPGKRVNVPIIGAKTAIFEPSMIPFYDYSITSSTYSDGTDCYVFTAKVKEGTKAHKTVIKYLETYFAKGTLQVVARKYQLAYYGLAFDFDVTMEIELRKLGDKYVPKFLTYDGFWDVPARKPERARFSTRFYGF